MKKAQIQGQVFIYIITLVIAGIIFLFGYKAIVGFTNQIEESKMLNFQIDTQKAFAKIGSEYGSMEKHTFVLPAKYELVCFVDLSILNEQYLIDNPDLLAAHPLIRDSVISGLPDNVFIYSNVFEKSLDVGPINIRNGTDTSGQIVPFHCFDLFNGKLFLKISGLGNKAEIQESVLES